MPRKAHRENQTGCRRDPQKIKIALPFEKAIEGLLSVKPKKKITKKKMSGE